MGEGMHRHELQGCDAELFEVVHEQGVGEAGVGAAQLGGEICQGGA